MDAMRHQHPQSFFGIPAAPAVAVAIYNDWEAVLAGYCALIWLIVTALQLEASLVHLMKWTLLVCLRLHNSLDIQKPSNDSLSAVRSIKSSNRCPLDKVVSYYQIEVLSLAIVTSNRKTSLDSSRKLRHGVLVPA